MVTPEEFLTELEREWVKADPMNRHTITLGFGSLMRSREEAIAADIKKRFTDHFSGDNTMVALYMILQIIDGGGPDITLTEPSKTIYNVAGNSDLLGEV